MNFGLKFLHIFFLELSIFFKNIYKLYNAIFKDSMLNFLSKVKNLDQIYFCNFKVLEGSVDISYYIYLASKLRIIFLKKL